MFKEVSNSFVNTRKKKKNYESRRATQCSSFIKFLQDVDEALFKSKELKWMETC